MICPSCGGEFDDGIMECPVCQPAPTEDAPAPDAATAATGPVAVFVSHSADLIAIAKSILIDAEIEFGVSGEQVQDFFGYGRFPVGVSIVAGPVVISVRAADADDARVLLSKLGDDSAPFPEDDEVDDADAGELSAFWRASRFTARVYSFAYIAVIALFVVAAVVLSARQYASALSSLWDSLIDTISP